MSEAPHLLTVEDLENSTKYLKVENIPVFAVSDKLKNGQRIPITKERLQTILAHAQQYERKHCFPVMTLGHRKMGPGTEKVPETEQPAPVGYSRFHAVGEIDGTPVLYASLYYAKETADEALSYPFRSVDYYPSTNEISGVALLRRDPELNLGVLTYARDGAILYELQERPPMPDPMNPNDPAQPASAETPDPGFHKAFMQCMKHSYPHLDGMHGKYAASIAPAPMQAPAPAVSATNGALPAGGPPLEKKEEKKEVIEPMQHQNAALAIQYAKQQETVTQMQAQIAALAYERDKARCDADVAVLVSEGKYIPDPEGLAVELAKLDPPGRDKRKTEIRQYWRDVDNPATIPDVRIAETTTPGEASDEEVIAFYRTPEGQGKTWQQAQAAVKAQKTKK